MNRALIIALLLLAGGVWTWNSWGGRGATAESSQVKATSAIMLDAATGQWLYEQNADVPMPPASMSKLMSEVLVLEEIRKGRLTWDEKVMVSSYAASVGGAGMDLREGQEVTTEELFRGMAIHSSNDATVALAERVAGNEREFVKRMNAKKKEIGLSKESYFANASGLSSHDLQSFKAAAKDGDTAMTARDVALLARYLINNDPDILRFTKEPLAEGFGTVSRLRTTNEMLPGQRFGTSGNDGLKTGYTKAAGYCFTGSFRKAGSRYITVVMGTTTPEARFEETRKLLDIGLEKKGDQV